MANVVPPKKVLDPVQLSLSLGEIAVRSHRLMLDFLTRRPELSGLGDPTGAGQAFLQLTAKLIADPMSIAQAQLELWADHMKLWQRTTERLFDPTGASDQRPATTDRRFQHPAWTENILFDYIKQSYLISAEAIRYSMAFVDRIRELAADHRDDDIVAALRTEGQKSTTTGKPITLGTIKWLRYKYRIPAPPPPKGTLNVR